MSRGNQRRVAPEVLKAARRQWLERLAKLALLGCLLVAFGASGWWLNQTMSVRQWKIEADAGLKQVIEAQLEAMPVKDFLSTQPALLRQQWLAAIPDMAEVRVTRILPDALHIQAEPRVPVALWQSPESAIFLLDEQGSAYRPLNQGESPDMPLLRVEAAMLAPACQLLAELKRVGKREQLSEIRSGGEYWQVYFARGEKWLLPHGAEEAVIHRLTTLLKKPRWQSRHWRVDARSSSRWFIRPARQGGII